MHLSQVQSKDPSVFKDVDSVVLEPPRPGVGQASIVIPAKSVQEKMRAIPPARDGKRRYYLMVTGTTVATHYGFGPDAVNLSAQMFDAACEMVKASLPPGLSEAEQRRQLFKRLYGKEIEVG